MENSPLKIKRAQVFIEAGLALVAVIILLLGIVRFWLWYNNDMAERQPPYTGSRVAAGSNQPGIWPPPGSTRRPLTEEWVFGGDLPAAVPYTPGATSATPRSSDNECENQALDKDNQARADMTQAGNLIVAAATLEHDAADLEAEASALDAQAAPYDAAASYYQGMYDSCISGCYGDPDCESGCQPYADLAASNLAQATAYHNQAQAKRDQASQKRAEAADDRTQSDNLRAEAENLFNEAYDIRTNCNQIIK